MGHSRLVTNGTADNQPLSVTVSLSFITASW